MIRVPIHEQIARNTRASLVYAFLLVLVLAALGGAITGYYVPDSWPFGMAAAAAIGILFGLIAWNAGSSIVLTISHAREATPLELQTLENVAEEMAIAAGIPKPKVFLIDDTAPNAFATGRNPREGVVVFTTGLVQKLDRDELQGVMAHEIAHIRNNDIKLMTTLAVVAGLVPLIADAFLRAQWWGGGRRSRDRDGGNAIFAILAILLAILAPLFAKLLELAVSRQREYLADATAAQLTRYPEGLARALEKISNDPEPLEAANRATQHMYIVNPLHKLDDASHVFSTHPPIHERIRRLRALAGVAPAADAFELPKA